MVCLTRQWAWLFYLAVKDKARGETGVGSGRGGRETQANRLKSSEGEREDRTVEKKMLGSHPSGSVPLLYKCDVVEKGESDSLEMREA